MTENTKQDPELFDDPEEGVGDEGMYITYELPDYDPDAFELPDDFEYAEDDDNG